MTAALLLQIALKASIVLAAAWVLTRAMTRFSAGARHLVWLLALLAALAMPAVQLFGPVWSLAILPSSPAVVVPGDAAPPTAPASATRAIANAGGAATADEPVSATPPTPAVAAASTPLLSPPPNALAAVPDWGTTQRFSEYGVPGHCSCSCGLSPASCGPCGSLARRGPSKTPTGVTCSISRAPRSACPVASS